MHSRKHVEHTTLNTIFFQVKLTQPKRLQLI